MNVKRLVLLVALAWVAAPAAAQTRVGGTKPAQDRMGLVAFGSFDFLNIASSQTFDAVFGTSQTHALGAGLDVVNIWKHVVLRVAVSKTSLEGTRVVVVNSTVYKLPTTLTVDMTPTEVGAGWRFVSKRGNARFTPYLGAEAVFLKYQETSTFADAAENVSDTFTGFGAFGGVDVRVAGQFIAGAEAQYRTINSAPGPNSVAASFNEKNLGGTVFRLKLGLRF